MLSEINQTEKDKYCMVSLLSGIVKKKKKTGLQKKDWNADQQGLENGENGSGSTHFQV